MTTPATGARCERCGQIRPLFPCKPLHDCADLVGPVSLVAAARYIEWIAETGDRWCEARLYSRPPLLCVPCHDREAADEAEFIKENKL
ncbi:hypothetical protein [Streptomyces sp. NPDC051173]|uniref:hypothetical protein n=1 Tax=Streptomyces sp. NPDC051173 TaxID=3155164 RepID=UPI0034507285